MIMYGGEMSMQSQRVSRGIEFDEVQGYLDLDLEMFGWNVCYHIASFSVS